MKKLSKLKWSNISQLNDDEMKFVIGGSGSGGGVCGATSGGSGGRINYCTNSASRAENWAGSNGWWCCNCSEALSACGSALS